jgi:hypothetical protein
MTSRHGLDVVLRVPVGIVDHDRVRRHQIDADAAGSRGEEHDAHGTLALLRELVDLFLPVSARDAPIDATVRVLCGT